MPINSFLYPATQVASGFEVANSVRLNGSNAYMNRTLGTATNRKKFTFSFWYKRELDGTHDTIAGWDSGGNLFEEIKIQSDQLKWSHRTSGGTSYTVQTNRLFRDPSAFYHLVIALDTTQGTDSNRVKIYVNGSTETSLATSNYPAQDLLSEINNNNNLNLFRWFPGSDYTGGYVSELVFIDGQALDPTSFGEFDEDTNIWKPKDVSELTFGTNGFYLDFEDSSSLGNDAAGSNNFTVNNLTSIDQTTDTCTNNFATLNPIAFEGASFGGQLTEGNTKVGGAVSSANNLAMGTFAVDTGKWYWEAKATASIDNYAYIGIRTYDSAPAKNQYVGESTGGIALRSDGYLNTDGSFPSQFSGISYTSGDIIGIALDMDNNKIYWYENGSLVNSGGTTITNRLYAPASSIYSNTGEWNYNFGNPHFSITSGNSDANGYGNFEYSVPSGYYALCTKNLAEYG